MTLLSNNSRSWAPIGGVAALVLIGMLAGGGERSSPDEAAFLYAVTRWRHGSVLYRDIFLGVTPLSVYVTGALAAFFGDEALVLRGLIHACVAVSALLSARLAIRLGGSSGVAAAAALATVTGMTAFCLNPPAAAYSPMAVVFLMAAWLVDFGRENYRRAAIAGALAGLAFCTKQNIGLLVLLALAVGSVRRPRRIALHVAGFAVAAAVTLAPVWWSAGRADFLDFCFRNKTRYVAIGGKPYLGDAALNPIAAVREDGWRGGLTKWTISWLDLLPLTVAGLLALRFAQKGDARKQTDGVLIFAGAAVAGIYPRADIFHVLAVSPPLIVGAAHLWDEARHHWPSAMRAGGIALVAVWVNAAVHVHLAPVYRIATGKMAAADLPHLHGTRWPPGDLIELRRNAAALRKAAAEDGPPFIVLPGAALYYLIADMRSPTRYIYPVAPALGVHGGDDLVRRIRDGSMRSVCVGEYLPDGLPPEDVLRAVKAEMVPAEDLGFCRMYIAGRRKR